MVGLALARGLPFTVVGPFFWAMGLGLVAGLVVIRKPQSGSIALLCLAIPIPIAAFLWRGASGLGLTLPTLLISLSYQTTRSLSYKQSIDLPKAIAAIPKKVRELVAKVVLELLH